MTETKPAPSPEQREFAAAMKKAGRIYPTWGEIIAIIEGLGYRRAGEGAAAELAAAMQAWKRETRIMFPTWGNVFDVLMTIGFVRVEKISDAA